MNIIRKRRLYWVLSIIAGVAIAVGIGLYALRYNINLYLTPTQVEQGQATHNQVFRMGGMVEKGSFHRDAGTLKSQFVLTNYQDKVQVKYTGILPTLFREGQVLVVQGRLNKYGIFIADEVLAKHDETYKPPGIKSK